MEQIFNEDLMDKNNIGYMHNIKAKLLFIQGKYIESLENVNKVIEISIKNGLALDDKLLINPYLSKVEILNYLKKYPEAYATAEHLYNMWCDTMALN